MIKILLIFFISISLYSKTLTLKGSIINGTKNSPGKVDFLRVLKLENGMQEIKKIENINGNFLIKNIEVSDSSPILLQGIYKGASYNKMIPPVPALREKDQKITVYETLPDLNKLKINSLVQIVREESGIRIYKIFLLDNETNPPHSISNDSEPLLVFIPDSAIEINGQLKQGTSKMGIPLSFTSTGEGRAFNRAILPGHSELELSYFIPEAVEELSIEDKMLFNNKSEFRPIFFKPHNMNVTFPDSIKAEEMGENTPGGLKGFKVYYPKNKKISINIKGGSPIKMTKRTQDRKIKNGSIFTSNLKSFYGTMAVLGLLFSLSFLFIYKRPPA